MKKIAVVLLIVFPVAALADILPLPLPTELPLHRVGYEFVFEMVALSAAGAAAVRALVKRRWKIRCELSTAEECEFGRKINSVLPRLVDKIVNVYLENERERAELIARARRLTDDPEQICKSVEDSEWIPLKNQKELLEKVLAQDDDLRQALDGVPIELVNESLVSRLPPAIRVICENQAGSLWTTEEDRREVEEACRRRKRPWNPLLSIFSPLQDERKEKMKQIEFDLARATAEGDLSEAEAFVALKKKMDAEKEDQYSLLLLRGRGVSDDKRVEGKPCERLCEHCGNKVMLSAIFCCYCGKKLSNIQVDCPLFGRKVESLSCLQCNHLRPADAGM